MIFSDGKELKPAPKIFKEDGLIDWNQEARTVYNMIRGFSPYPTAWTRLQNMNNNTDLTLKIYISRISDEKSTSPGSINTDGKTFLKIQTLDYCIEIQELQLQGKKRMKVADFLRGFSIDEHYSCFKP